MDTVSATEVRAKFAQFLRHASEYGRRILIERRGKSMAVLVPTQDLELLYAGDKEPPNGIGETLYESVARIAELGYWIRDELEDRCTYCSDVLVEIMGVSDRECLERFGTMDGLTKALHPDDRARYVATVEAARRSHAPYRVDVRGMGDDGRIRHLQERGEPVFDASGRHVRTVGTIQFIGEQNQLEGPLHESVARYRDIVETVDDLILHVGPDGRIELVNRSWMEKLGYSASEAWRMSFSNLLCSDDVPRFRTMLERLKAGEIFERAEFVFSRKNGAEIIAQGKMVPVVRDGVMKHAICIFKDIMPRRRYERELEPSHDKFEAGVAARATHLAAENEELVAEVIERKREEADLRESEQYFRTVVENSPSAILLKDLEGRILIVNQRAKDWILGDEQDLTGKTLHEICDNEIAEKLVAQDEEVLRTRQVIEQEYSIEFKDGDHHAVEVQKFPVFDDHWQPIGIGSNIFDVTERKRAETALRESEDRFRNFFEYVPVAVRASDFSDVKRAIDALEIEDVDAFSIYLDRHPEFARRCAGLMKFVNANQAAVELHGCKNKQELLSKYGRPGSEASMVVFKSILSAIFRGDTGIDIESRVTRTDGVVREVMGRWAVSSGFEESFGRTLLTSIDITERKHAEAARVQTEERLLDAVESIPDGFALFDAEDRLVLCNEHYRGAHPLRANALEPDVNFQDMLRAGVYGGEFPDALGREEEWIAERLVAHAAPSGPIEQRVFGGRWLRTEEKRTREGGIVAIRTDITELKNKERDLRESEQRLRQATELAGLGHWVWDALEDKCAFCSEETARIHGMTVQDYMGKTSTLESRFRMVHPEDRAAVEDRFVALRRGQGFDIEYRIQRLDGMVRHVREIAAPVLNRAGRVVREHGSTLDLTEMKQAEEQLRQAQKMETVGQLTGGISHDFNNLLGIALANLELMELEIDDGDRCLDYVRGAMQAVRRGAELTRQLLAYSRKQALKPGLIDPSELLPRVSQLLARTLDASIEISVDVEVGAWTIEVDPVQLETALINLCLNARDAMPRGGELNLTAKNLELADPEVMHTGGLPCGEYLMLSVGDTGTGIERSILAEVFDPFFTTKEVGAGSGLGLSMVFGFVRQSDGEVKIESEPGHGTRVDIYLPRAKSVSVEHSQSNPLSSPTRGRGETVLVVEDDPQLLALAVTIIESLGYHAVPAEDAEKALAVLDARNDVAVLFTDISLTRGLDGTELAVAAKRMHPTLEIVYTSGAAHWVIDKGGTSVSEDNFVAKPYKIPGLARTLRRAIDGA